MANNTSDHQIAADNGNIIALFQDVGIEDENLSLNKHAQLDEDTLKPSPFLSAPLEIRCQIYRYFLKCDETQCIAQSSSPYPFNFKILSICGQIRDEAWEYFCTSNRWIQHATFRAPEDGVPQGVRKPSLFEVPLDLFPKNKMVMLNSHITLTIRAGVGCGRKKACDRKPLDRHIFAYNKPDWLHYCMTLSIDSDQFYNFSFDLHPRYRTDFMPLLQDFLVYLLLVHDAKRVRFTQMMDKALFKNMADNMTNTIHFPAKSLQEYYKGLLEEGNSYQANGDLIFATIFYAFGHRLVQEMKEVATNALFVPNANGLVFKNPKMMAAHHIGTDLELAYYAASQKRTETRKVNGMFPLHTYFEINRLRTSIDAMLSWPGTTPEQRSRAHHIRGTTALHMAEYVADPTNAAYVSSKVSEGISVNPHVFYRNAAYDFFHAAEIDPVAGDTSKAMWSKISDLLGETETLKPQVVSLDIPGYGTWKGDVSFWNDNLLTADQYAMFHHKDFCTKQGRELTALKERLGIRWEGEPAGMLRLLLM